MRLFIRVYGRPAPQGSKERGSAGQLLESSAYLPAWMAAVRGAAYATFLGAEISPEELPVFGSGVPVIIEKMTFIVAPEQCRAEGTDAPIGTPDIDKLLRSTLDALGGARRRKTARVFADDSQVQGIRELWKVRATPDQPPGAIIIISDGRD